VTMDQFIPAIYFLVVLVLFATALKVTLFRDRRGGRPNRERARGFEVLPPKDCESGEARETPKEG
jgi:hypothetical protein